MSDLTLPEGETAAYIFDCDGTLADSMPMHYRAWKQAFEKHHAKFDFTWDLFYSMAGTGMHDSVVQLNARFGDDINPDAVVADQKAFMEAEHPSVRPINRVLELARELKREGYPVAVASGGDRDHVHDTLRYIGAADLFEVVVTKQDVVRSKPAPDGFLKAAELLGVPADKCVVFEDSQLGLRAAEDAGMRWVFVCPKKYSAGAGI